MTVGETWLFFVPPGWILGGTIVSQDDTVVVLRDAVYFEGCSTGHALLSSLPRATTIQELRAACPTSWGLPDGYIVRREAILHGGPCKMAFTGLARAADAAAIKGAR